MMERADMWQDYTIDNPNIDLLRLRNFTISRKLKDEEVTGPKGLQRIAQLMAVLTPFVGSLKLVSGFC